MTSALDRVVGQLHITGQRGDTYDARCPAHDDKRASLTVSPGRNGGTVVHCHAGCEPSAILEALGLTFADISAEPHVVATYVYRDEEGARLWDVDRYEPKTFRCRPGLPPRASRRLYHSEFLPDARSHGMTVYVVEGEKDVENLTKLGEIAVCGVGGAGSWLPQYAEQLRGLDVVIVADKDEPGFAHARAVAHSLDGVAAAVTLVEPSFGKDISDQLDAGYDLATLVPLPVDEILGVYRADRVREREIEWLWPGYLPTGKMVIVEGDPGDGKSVMTCDLAARFSTGSPLPDGSKSPDGPINVAMISAEDDPEDTIVPRLRVAGSDLRRVHLITEGTIPTMPFDLRRDQPALEAFVTANKVRLLVIDPLMAFMPADTNAYSDHEVRRALHPLTKMAMRTGCTLVVVRHLTKGRTKAITAGGGSIAFIGAARVGFLVGPHPEDETKRALSCVKINVAAKPSTLGYRILADEREPHIPRVHWDDAPLDVSAQEILDGDEGEDSRSAREDAKDFLDDLLLRNLSGLKWAEIVRLGKIDGHTEITLRRVRRSIAHAERNPADWDGSPRFGTFWLRNKPDLKLVQPEDEDEVHPAVKRAREAKAEAETPALTVVDIGPKTSGGCDVCGQEPAVTFGAPHNVRRCSTHNPLTYAHV